ncbi:hypothetical protein PanWU01x14_351880 [Parasponia andersonii]|uniref:Rapid ALkalinization Factor n=1 Tax=Parasponia andersonii TaxID=3476 RepID=A0A2P5AAI1_PARAD|nr:hypothetical protein PanWU01x14_351880 [Parasponia andersonii]
MGAILMRGLFKMLLLMMTIMVILLSNTSNYYSYASGTVSPSVNSTAIAYQDLEMEFLMDSETSRRVLAPIRFQTAGTSNPNNAALCGRGRYRSCTGNPSKGPVKDNCATYKRNCPINR